METNDTVSNEEVYKDLGKGEKVLNILKKDPNAVRANKILLYFGIGFMILMLIALFVVMIQLISEDSEFESIFLLMVFLITFIITALALCKNNIKDEIVLTNKQVIVINHYLNNCVMSNYALNMICGTTISSPSNHFELHSINGHKVRFSFCKDLETFQEDLMKAVDNYK